MTPEEKKSLKIAIGIVVGISIFFAVCLIIMIMFGIGVPIR